MATKSISALSIPPLDYEFPKKVGSYEFNVIKEKGVEAIDILEPNSTKLGRGNWYENPIFTGRIMENFS